MAINKELLLASELYSRKYNIPVSVILGFAGLETNFGKTGMGKSKNNLFGIGSNTYSSIAESVEDFCKLVTGNKDSSQSKKYGEATKNAKTISDWINAIRDAGYNSEYEDGVYEQKVMDVITSHNLTQYDDETYEFSYDDLTENVENAGFRNNNTVWWGDMIVTIFSIILVIMGVVFMSLAVTSISVGQNVVQKIISKGGNN